MLSKLRGALRAGIKLEEAINSKTIARSISSKQAIDRESKYACHNYHPIPAVLAKGEGNYKKPSR